MAAKPKKKKLPAVSSAAINEFIAKHASECLNWRELRDLIRKELRVEMTPNSVSQRGQRLGVTTKGRCRPLKTVEAQVKPADLFTQSVLAIIRKKPNVLTVEDIANAIDASPLRVRRAIEELKSGGHNIVLAEGNVELSRDIPKADPFRINVKQLKGKTFKFGLTADNHLASKYQRLDVLEALFDVWEAEGISTVYQLGNLIDGDARFNKFDVICTGLEAQSRYAAQHWPRRKGMKTYFITGDDHEGWYVQREGVEVGRYMEGVARNEGRDDMIYLGHMEHDIVFSGTRKKTVMRLIHAGGGSAYATSYAAQKIVESYQGGEKPSVLLIGHYHKAEYGYPREVHVVQGGCTCDQTPFMRKNKIQAHVGGWTIEMTINPEGVITRFRQEWIPFFDKGYYTDAWKYQNLGPHSPLTSRQSAA